MDKKLLTKYFNEFGYQPTYISFSQLDFTHQDYSSKIFLYTSSEDKGYHYKSFIEDVIFSLEVCGAKVIPQYKFLRANNNKVFMEQLREIYKVGNSGNIKSHYFGTIEELKRGIDKVTFPCVVKSATGAMSSGFIKQIILKNYLKV